MQLTDIMFFISAMIVIASGVTVVFSRNVMYSAFSLLFTFFGVAMLYVLLSAEFIAISQIMIYIGGILVLIIFGVMMTSRITGVDIKSGIMGKAQMALGGATSLVLCVLLCLMFVNSNWKHNAEMQVAGSNVQGIGEGLLTSFLLPFEVASVLLLIAIIGAALIARRGKS